MGLPEAGLLETALWVLLRNTDEARQQFTPSALSPDAAAEQMESAQLDVVARATGVWIHQLQQVSLGLAAREESGATGRELAALLSDYASQIEAIFCRLEESRSEQVHWSGQRKMDFIWQLLELAYRLRDELTNRLAAELSGGQRAALVPAALRVDADAGVYNRVGLEYITARFIDEKQGTAPDMTLVRMDIDRFHRLNQRLGAAQADLLLQAFSNTVERLLPQNPGYSCVARVNGQSFVLFLGHTALSAAEGICEQLRQSLESSDFVLDKQELQLTVSCGAVAFQSPFSVAAAMALAQTALAEARRAGRNRTCIYDGQKAVIAQPKPGPAARQRVEVLGPARRP
jgi:diguanylate cyclase (GGDEF)-like protein